MSDNIDKIVKRLLWPPFGTETSERLLMGTAADAIRHLAKQEVDIRTAYCTVRADNAELARENKRLDRECAAAETEITRLREALSSETAAREKAERERDTYRDRLRWNVDDEGRLVRVCKGDHDKGEDCEFELYVPEACAREARAAILGADATKKEGE